MTKTSTSSRSGSEGPYSSQAEADAAAASAKASAESELRAEAQGMVDRAIATAKSELASIDFRFDETVVPVGFEFYAGEHGSKQTISVPMDSSDEYLMLRLHKFRIGFMVLQIPFRFLCPLPLCLHRPLWDTKFP